MKYSNKLHYNIPFNSFSRINKVLVLNQQRGTSLFGTRLSMAMKRGEKGS
jgi:hypothetical protein